MRVPRRQVGNQDPMRRKWRRKSDPKSLSRSGPESEVLIKRIRVVFSDPDATDSSSDDESAKQMKPKRVIREIPILPSRSPPASALSSGSSKSKGVRYRPWGKWVAEIRDPIRGLRIWLGTYESEVDATLAYQAASQRFEAEKRIFSAASASDTSFGFGSSNQQPFLASSPSSVLDVTAVGFRANIQDWPTKDAGVMPLTDFLVNENPLMLLPDFVMETKSDPLLEQVMLDDCIGLGEMPLWEHRMKGHDFADVDFADLEDWLDSDI